MASEPGPKLPSAPPASSGLHIARSVLFAEATTDISHNVLRLAIQCEQPDEINDADAARSQEYALLAVLLARVPNASLLRRIAKLPGDAMPLEIAHAALAQAADNATAETIERGFFNPFIGIGRGELLPYGPYYLTGFLNDMSITSE
jgi:hypothetical protein